MLNMLASYSQGLVTTEVCLDAQTMAFWCELGVCSQVSLAASRTGRSSPKCVSFFIFLHLSSYDTFVRSAMPRPMSLASAPHKQTTTSSVSTTPRRCVCSILFLDAPLIRIYFFFPRVCLTTFHHSASHYSSHAWPPRSPVRRRSRPNSSARRSTRRTIVARQRIFWRMVLSSA